MNIPKLQFILLSTFALNSKFSYPTDIATTEKQMLSKNKIIVPNNTDESTFVKLTRKQGLLMNQVLAFYSLDQIDNELCKNHTKEFKKALRKFQPWALKMFDSSSKLQSGILLGNLVDFGSFFQCLGIREETIYGPVFGKHCLMQIQPSLELIEKVLSFNNISYKKFQKLLIMVEKSVFYWSVCVPHSCPKEDIFRHFNKTFNEISQGLNLSFALDENYCNSVLNYPVLETTQYVVLIFFTSVIVLELIASLLDIKLKETKSVFIDTFSIYKNINRIFDAGGAKSETEFIHGLRSLSAFFVILGHRYIMYIMFPVINQVEELNWLTQYSSLPILGSTVSVDSFFFISAMLTSMGFFEHVAQVGSFNLFFYYLHRYVRITSPLALVVLFYVTLPQFLGTGPYMYDVYKNHQKSCEDYWWSTLLHIQSFINAGHLCIYQVWYLSCEMPFYFLSPIILYPIWKYPKIGYSIMLIIFVLSLWLCFYLAWINRYEGYLLPITNQLFETKYFQKYYIVPYTRACPYILGLAVGHFNFTTKNKHFKIQGLVVVLIWILAIFVMGAATCGCHIFFLETHEYNLLESSSYQAFARVGWTIGLSWVTWACMHGYGGLLNEFLSAYIFKIISRISYGLFLTHSIVQLYKDGSEKAPKMFSNFNAVYDGLADIFTSLLIAIMFTAFFELPIIKLSKLLFGFSTGRKNKTKVLPKR